MTTTQIENLATNKIQSVTLQISKFATTTLLKVFKNNKDFIVVTREGILKYLGNAEYALYSGKKNVHYKVFKNSNMASKYIKSQIQNN
jgi:hypothetical protein